MDLRTMREKEWPQGTSQARVRMVWGGSFCLFPKKITVTFKTIRPTGNKTDPWLGIYLFIPQ